MQKKKNILLQRRDFIRQRVKQLAASGLTTTQGISIVAKELFLSEKTTRNDFTAKMETHSTNKKEIEN
jgi:hypothetical protein